MNKNVSPFRGLLFAIALFLFALSFANANPGSLFIANKGQWEGPFSYKSQFGNLSVFADESGFRFLLSQSIPHHHELESQLGQKYSHQLGHGHSHEVVSMHAFSLRLLESNSIEYMGVDQRSGIHNYFLGNEPSKWVSRVPLFNGVRADEIYEGISIQAYGSEGAFKYDFIVKPGADPAQIKLDYTGLESFKIGAKSITLRTSLGELVESLPISYQIIDGQKVEVACRYKRLEKGFGFEFPQGYDEGYELVIDPVLVAATLSGTGSGGANYGHGASFDLAGNIYTHARSFNSAYPVTEGAFQQVYGGGGTDVAVSKLTPDGSDLIYATFLGGNGGDLPISSIVNGNEELYVYGNTTSSDFPTSPSAFQTESGGSLDIFIVGLSSDGTELVGSTYLGGSSDDGGNILGAATYDNLRGEINLNLNGEVYLSSCSSSGNFPVTSGVLQETKNSGQDAVILKMNENLSELIWSTFLGSEGDDMAYGIRVKDDQTVFVCGGVSGDNIEDFPTTSGAFQEDYSGGPIDGFVTHISENAETIIESSFVGAPGSDVCYFLDLDNNDNVWVYMLTTSDWPVSDDVWGGVQGSLCVHKLSDDLSTLDVTSYLSNSGNGASGTPVAFMVDLCNNIYTSAYGASGFNPSEDALFDNGGFFLAVFTPDMEDAEYGTYYTGNHVDGGTSRFDKQGIVYQGVCISGGFNTTDNAWAPDQVTSWDIGVFKIDFEIESVYAAAGAAGYLTGCAPHTAIFQNFSEGETYEWDFGNGETSTEYEPTTVYPEPGEYIVQMIVTDSTTCNISDTAFIPITVLPPVDFFTEFTWEIDCETGELQITDSSSGPEDVEYEWNMGDGTILTDVNPTHIYAAPGTYTVTLTLSSDACNQEMVEEQEVEYIPFIGAGFSVEVLDICDSYLIGIENLSGGGTEFTWNMGDGTTLTGEDDFEYTYEQDGTYTIELIIEDALSCNLADTFALDVTLDAPPILNPEISITQTGFCNQLDAIAEVDVSGEEVQSYEWFINDNSVGNEQVLEASVLLPGVYTVEVVVIDPICEVAFADQVVFQFYDSLGFVLPPSLPLCYYESSLILNATVPFDEATYNWNQGQSNEPVLEVFEGGSYEVEVGFNGCIEVQSTNINAVPEIPLAFEELICEGQPNLIEFPDDFSIVEQVFWDDGQTGFTIEVSQAGYYPFNAVDLFGCDQVDSLLAVARDDDPNLQIPNVFTPNADGFNDVFEIQGDELVYFELEIFDRWGRLVHSTNEIYGTWDGSYTEGSGSEGGEDTFMYILKYRDLCDLETQVKTGDLQILR
jgi:gliding motility-associated-like protein